MSLSITLIESADRELLVALRARGYRVNETSVAEVASIHPLGSKGPDAFLVDTRGSGGLPRDLAGLKRQFPTAGVVIVAKSLDPTGMLEAMRLGITEWLAEPVAAADLDAAIQRVTRPVTASSVRGRTFAIVGGKGGVGCTTIAVNLATAIRNASKEPTLLLDLHLAQGDTSVFLGVEPRFTVLDALENIHRLDNTYFKGLITPTPSGVDLLASANRAVLGSIDVMRVKALFEFVVAAYPWVIIDCPRSDPAVLDSLELASSVVVVANQELATLRSASRLAALLRQRCGPTRVKLVINRFDTDSEISRKDVERVLGGSIAYTFPSDYRTAVAALNKGEPVVNGQQGRLPGTFDEAARDLAGLQAAVKETVKPGLFGRLGRR